MENNLPKGWTETSFDQIADATDYVANGSFQSLAENVETRDTKDYAILVRLRDYNRNWDRNGLVYVTRKSFDFLSKSSLIPGDLFIANVGAPGKAFIIPDLGQPMTLGPNGLRIRGKGEITNKFLYYYYSSPTGKSEIENLIAGSAQQKFNKTGLRASSILIPPIAEQQRIVAKLDELMEKIERSRARLERIPKILKRFRQSILSAAVSGQLFNSESEWREVNLGSLVKKGDIFDGPFGSNLKTSDYTDKGIRVIRLENIEHLYFVNEKETFISKDKYMTLLRHTVGEGDIIFSSFITEEIRACMLPKFQTKAIAKADCFCIRPNENLVNKKFLLYSLVSSNSYNQLVVNIHGATRPRINTSQLKELSLSLPELEEQDEIVSKVDELFALADKIEARYNKAKAQIDKLPQSLLAKAFRGELVPQDENDEPASVLLERIKQKGVTESVKGKSKREIDYELQEHLSMAAEPKRKYAKKKQGV